MHIKGSWKGIRDTYNRSGAAHSELKPNVTSSIYVKDTIYFEFSKFKGKTTTLCGVLFSSAEWVYMIAQNHKMQQVKKLFALVGIGSTYTPSSLSANTVITSTSISSLFLCVFLSLCGRKRLCLYLLAYWGRVRDEKRTLKTPIPKCRHYWSFLGGFWSNFVGSKSVEGQQYTSTYSFWVENTNHEWMYLQSIKSVKHNAAKSVNRSILKQTFRVRCLYGSFVHGRVR
jgi:hypothetical protein